MSDAELRANLAAVRERVGDAARRAGRPEDAVLLVAVSKTIAVERIRAAIEAGVRALGENRVQEARRKIEVIGRPLARGISEPPRGAAAPDAPRPVEWHLVGHLQTNKVRDAVECFDLIHSVDRLPLAEALSSRAARVGRRVDVLVQVNLAGEPQKGGLAPGALRPVLEAMVALPGLRVRGLMTVPPLPRDAEDSRPHYRELRKLLETARGWGLGSDFAELSMGMSGDFEVAIEEGATIVRVGTAVFGPRGH